MSLIRAAVLAAVATALATVTFAFPSTAGALPPPGTVLFLTWDEGNMYSVDPTDASTTLVGGDNVISSSGLAWDEANSTLYAIDYDFTPASLYTVDPDTGAGTNLGSLDLEGPTGLDVQPGTSELFMVYDDVEGSGSILATIDPSGPTVTDIGPTTDSDTEVRLRAIAFHPGDGTLYGVGYNSNFYEIDPATGNLTLLYTEFSEAFSLAFSCDGSTLYATDTTSFSTIDVDTGTVDEVGSLGLPEDSFTENVAVICYDPVEPTTTTTAPTTTVAPVAPAAAARPVAVTPTFTG